MDKILSQTREQMDEVLALAQDDIGSVRVGRAKPAMVQDIKVQAYGSSLTLKEVANISATDPQNLIIKPWDENVLEDIEKGIQKSGLGLNPVVDKNMIRIHIPPLTSEQREEMAKLVDQKAESARVMVRQVRTTAKDKIESEKGKPGVSEDDVHNHRENLQKMTDEFIEKINTITKERKEELTSL
jgi:ribosome recycling factor